MTTYWIPQTKLMTRCRALGLSPHIVQEASNDQMQINFIAAGMGVGFVNRSMAMAGAAGIIMRPVDDLNVALQLDLVWKRPSKAPSLENFVRIMQQHAPVQN